MKTNKLRVSIALFAALLLALTALVAHAFPGEPNGWGKHGWGVKLNAAYKTNPDFRNSGQLKAMMKAIENGDVVLDSTTEFLDKRWDTKWFFGKQGLYTVVLKWEDTRMDAHGSHKKVFKRLTSSWGTPKETGADGELIWEGKLTRIEARRVRIATGASVEVKLIGKTFGSDKPTGAASSPSKSGGSVVDDLIDLPD